MAVIRFVLADQDDVRLGKLRDMLNTRRNDTIGEGELRMPDLTGSTEPRIDEDGEAG